MSEPESGQESIESITIKRRGASYQLMRLGEYVPWAILPVAVAVTVIALHPTGIGGSQADLSALLRGSWAVVGFSAAIGIASAGLVQLVKQLGGVRGYFQRDWVTEWIEDRISNTPLWDSWASENREKLTGIPKRQPDGPSSELAALIADSQSNWAIRQLQTALLGGISPRELQRVFDLPTEQLCAQIGIAADLAMTQPHLYAELLLALMGPTGLSHIDALAPPVEVRPDGRVIRQPGASDLESSYDRVYPLASQAVRTGVDLLQISLSRRWRRGVQLTAIVVSGSLGVIGAFLLREPLASQILLGITALFLGGFFAWLARDLFAIVERARR